VGLDDAAGALVLYFGMTSFPKYFRRPKAAPEHPRLVLELDDGYRLGYACQRLLGKIGFTDDPDAWIEEHGLGWIHGRRSPDWTPTPCEICIAAPARCSNRPFATAPTPRACPEAGSFHTGTRKRSVRAAAMR